MNQSSFCQIFTTQFSYSQNMDITIFLITKSSVMQGLSVLGLGFGSWHSNIKWFLLLLSTAAQNFWKTCQVMSPWNKISTPTLKIWVLNIFVRVLTCFTPSQICYVSTYVPPKKVKNLCHACSFSFLEVTYLSRTIKNVPKKVEHQWLWSWHYHIKKKTRRHMPFFNLFSPLRKWQGDIYIFLPLITYSDFYYI